MAIIASKALHHRDGSVVAVELRARDGEPVATLTFDPDHDRTPLVLVGWQALAQALGGIPLGSYALTDLRAAWCLHEGQADGD